MNDQNTINAYLKTKVMTASPEELRMLLLDGAIRFANTAKYGLENKDHEKIFDGFTQCRSIVLELTNTIDPRPNPELAEQVKNIYVFLYGELVSASINKDLVQLNKAIELLEYERETWAQLMEQLIIDRNAGLVPSMPVMPENGSSPLSIQA